MSSRPPWDQPATLIDVHGKAPMVSTIPDCAAHFAILKPFATEQARILLTCRSHAKAAKREPGASTERHRAACAESERGRLTFSGREAFAGQAVVRTAGLEPARPVGQKILSLQRLPFRHVRTT